MRATYKVSASRAVAGIRSAWLTCLFALLAATGLALSALPSAAQEYPSRPIRFIVAFPAGGGNDIMGRSMAKELGEVLGQQMVVENRDGATGLIGLQALTSSPPDGYTVMQLANTTTTSLGFRGQPLDLEKRFDVVGGYDIVPLMLVVNPNVINVKNVAEFAEYAKKNPGLAYTSSGTGSPSNIIMEIFAKQNNLSLTYVPYRGSGPAILDVMAGRVGAMVVDNITAKPHVQSGGLRAIAVTSSVRTTWAPDVPTATEQGFPALTSDAAVFLVVPPGTPQPIMTRLREALRKATLAEAKAEETQRKIGVRYIYVDGPEARDWLQKDYDLWKRLIKEANIKPPE